MIRRTVLVFAALGLALAALMLTIESGLLFVIAIGADEVWQGSLNLNQYFGRVPRPEMIGDTRIVVTQSLGFFAFYLPALATLTAGGIGLILRKSWGYYSHLAGSVLVAVTCFGILYTIPALAFAIRPEFKEHCHGEHTEKPKPDPLGDL